MPPALVTAPSGARASQHVALHTGQYVGHIKNSRLKAVLLHSWDCMQPSSSWLTGIPLLMPPFESAKLHRMWKTDDLVHSRTIDLGEAWVTDCVWLPYHERLAVSTSDHAVRCAQFYLLSYC